MLTAGSENAQESGTQPTGADVRHDVLLMHNNGNWGYTVVIEHFTNSVDGVTQPETVIRATMTYRLEHGQWRIAHRHAELIPTP